MINEGEGALVSYEGIRLERWQWTRDRKRGGDTTGSVCMEEMHVKDCILWLETEELG